MAITWSCPVDVSTYARLGRNAPAPRPDCSGCGSPMAFDGSYRRRVRESGVVHEIFVRRAWCRACKVGDALFPDFVLRRRLDSTLAVGAAVLEPVGVELPDGARGLCRSVPARTVRSWRQRFSERADDLAVRFMALTAHLGGALPFRSANDATPVGRATDAIGFAWLAASRRDDADLPPAWRLANVIVGGQLLCTRVDLPWPIDPAMIGRSRGP
ncbi:MAG: hypothetical protein ACLQU9_20000 [Acidimicrobiales bacterium]